jgi:hypothetical protein
MASIIKTMITRRSKIWLSFVLMITVLGHFGLGHRDISTFVLCFGADGHVALERIGANLEANVDKTTQPKSEANTYFTDGDLPCNSPCTDIPIGEDGDITYLSLTDLSKVLNDLGFLPLFSLVFLFVIYPIVVTQRRLFSDPLFTDPRLLALSSTVLRI